MKLVTKTESYLANG